MLKFTTVCRPPESWEDSKRTQVKEPQAMVLFLLEVVRRKGPFFGILVDYQVVNIK